MADITIHRIADDGLSRQCWDFSRSRDYSGSGIVLTRFAIERRQKPKGRFKNAVPAESWRNTDERRYYSGLSRPTSIPDDVIREALSCIQMTVWIGWTNEGSVYGAFSLSPSEGRAA